MRLGLPAATTPRGLRFVSLDSGHCASRSLYAINADPRIGQCLQYATVPTRTAWCLAPDIRRRSSSSFCHERDVTIRANGAMAIFGRPHQVVSDPGKKRAEPKLDPSEHFQFQVGSVVVGQKHWLVAELRCT